MGNRKDEILIVALHLFARDGYEAVSVSQIAAMEDGIIDEERLKSYKKLKAEPLILILKNQDYRFLFLRGIRE